MMEVCAANGLSHKFMDLNHYAESCKFHLGVFCVGNESVAVSPYPLGWSKQLACG